MSRPLQPLNDQQTLQIIRLEAEVVKLRAQLEVANHALKRSEEYIEHLIQRIEE